MSWLSWLTGGQTPAEAEQARLASEADARRLAEWETALQRGRLPGFVAERLQAASAGRTPWLTTMTAAELMLARSHGIRPIATVSGTCWFHYGYSWTKGHSAGWHAALSRLKLEAAAAGANAVVDVKMRRINLDIGESMDFTVLGTAVRFDGLPPSPDPVVATVPALEFARLLEAGIVPVGIGIGAHYEWLSRGGNLDGAGSFSNRPLTGLGNFWERVRRIAHAELRRDTVAQGNGVLAHTHFGQLFKIENDDAPGRYLGRHIVVGTIVDAPRRLPVPHGIEMVLDMNEAASPLSTASRHGHTAYDDVDQEGEI